MDNTEIVDDGSGAGGGEVTGIAGTPYKTPEELAKGYQNLHSMHGALANEFGQTKKELEATKAQAQTLAQLLEKFGGQPKQEAPPANVVDYKGMKEAIKAQLSELDPLDANFSKTHTALVSKLTDITEAEADAKINKVISVAAKTSQEEVAKFQAEMARKTQKEKFIEQNPDFEAPETQEKIRAFLAQDKTGVHDKVSAYFQIQRDEIAAQAKQLSTVNAEMQKRLDLAKGADLVGKTVVKGQSPNQQQTNTPVPKTDNDVKAGMMAALKASRGGT